MLRRKLLKNKKRSTRILPAAKSGRRKLCVPLADEMNIDWGSTEITDLIDRALREDIGDGDVTSRTLFSKPRKISGYFSSKTRRDFSRLAPCFADFPPSG